MKAEGIATVAGDGSLWGLLDARVRRTPDALAFVDELGRRVTFAQFRNEAMIAAAGLGDLGVGDGQVVSWILPTSIDTFVMMAALSRLSVVQNPIVPIYRAREIAHIVDEAKVDLLFVPPPWRGVDYPALARSIASERQGRPRVLVLDGGLPQGDPHGLPARPEALSSDHLARVRWLFYTSGSTGRPKGTRHSDASLFAAARGMADRLAMVPSDRSGLAFPAAHIGGPVNLFAGLLSGAAYILIEQFEPDRSVAVLQREGVTMAGSGTAFHLGYLGVQRHSLDTPIFPLLRCCPGGGAPKPPGLHAEVKQHLGGVGILSSWGMTEAPVLTMGQSFDDDDKLATTEGRPLPGVELRVVRPDGSDASPGQVGELRVRAPQMMSGYVDEAQDADVFDSNGFLRTGDLGVVDAEGFVTITGRLKDVIIRNGENIAAAEVEELVRLHPAVADAAVIGLADARTGERVCAVVELRVETDALDVGAVASHLKALGLRPQAWPEQVEVVPQLPRTVAGKIDKLALSSRYGALPV